ADLLAFPTRRSSDLGGALAGRGARRDGLHRGLPPDPLPAHGRAPGHGRVRWRGVDRGLGAERALDRGAEPEHRLPGLHPGRLAEPAAAGDRRTFVSSARAAPGPSAAGAGRGAARPWLRTLRRPCRTRGQGAVVGHVTGLATADEGVRFGRRAARWPAGSVSATKHGVLAANRGHAVTFPAQEKAAGSRTGAPFPGRSARPAA